ncbi:MAG TPA: tetratricopeptide repeat protein [Methylotenera sp.]|nr:tetratricopeptide repeat protein [Methylotenera sp.]
MSLLIKALNKAEEAQAKNTRTEQAQSVTPKKNQAIESKVELELEIEADASNKPHSKTTQYPSKNAGEGLSLSPNNEFSGSETKPVTATPSSAHQFSSQDVAAKSAANVFSAKGIDTKTENARLIIIAGAGLIILLGIGFYFYQFVDSSPPVLLPPRPLEQIATTSPAAITAENVFSEASKSEVAALDLASSATEPAMPPTFESTEITPTVSRKNTNQSALVHEDDSLFEAGDSSAEESLSRNSLVGKTALNDDRQVDSDSNRFQASFSANNAGNKTRISRNNASAKIASESASISVTKSTPAPSVNPALLSAYDAYNAGNDVEAQKLYKQVLRSDIRNVDALLGLGAIASRQGRVADANGWYGKVLEVDPRNSIAKTAMLDSSLMSNPSFGNELTNETNLKNMLAKQPDDANLHVALGNLYAEQNQWPAAQQAYFEAYSLNKTTDNAYNLAVSLDQMGKPKLALPYYIRALEQATDASNIDKAALQARISAIQ